MTIAQKIKQLEEMVGNLQQELVDCHEWQALSHIQSVMHELNQAHSKTVSAQIELAKSLLEG